MKLWINLHKISPTLKSKINRDKNITIWHFDKPRRFLRMNLTIIVHPYREISRYNINICRSIRFQKLLGTPRKLVLTVNSNSSEILGTPEYHSRPPIAPIFTFRSIVITSSDDIIGPLRSIILPSLRDLISLLSLIVLPSLSDPIG